MTIMMLPAKRQAHFQRGCEREALTDACLSSRLRRRRIKWGP